MVDLDLKDRKILYQLDLNCRQSNAQIGKKVGLSRKVVEYRIKRMEEEEIINGYWTNIDSYRFGYQVYRYYLIFQNATSNIREKIVENILNYKNTWVVSTLKGLYDLTAVIWVKSIPQFYQFWDTFNEKYGDNIAEKIFSVYLEADVYPPSYLIKELDYAKDREHPEHNGGTESIEIDFSDYQLLDIIANNARIPTVELADKLGCSSQSANYRLQKLMKNQVIQGFHIGINVSAIDMEEFKVDIWLKELSKRKKIWNIIKDNPYVTFINTSAGYADIEIEFTIDDSDLLLNVIENLSSKFPGAIRKYIYWGIKHTYRLRCLPELTEEDFKK